MCIHTKMYFVSRKKNHTHIVRIRANKPKKNPKLGVGWIWAYTMNWQRLQDIQGKKTKLKQIEKIMKIDINASLIKRPVERNKTTQAIE